MASVSPILPTTPPDTGCGTSVPLPSAPPAPAHPRRRSPATRLALLITTLIAAAAIVHYSPIYNYLDDLERLRHTLDRLGLWTYPATVLTVAVLVSCGVPRLAFCALSGALLGFWPGLLTTQLGTLLGYYAVFCFIRWARPDAVLRRAPKLQRLADLVHQQGFLGVLLLRHLPLHGTLVNLCLAVSRVKHRHFLAGTAVGILTEAIPATLVGAGLVKVSGAETARFLAGAAVAVLALLLLSSTLLKKLRRSQPGAALEAEARATTTNN